MNLVLLKLKIINYISLFGCIKNHKFNLKIKDFLGTQNINISNIICEKCKVKDKANSPNNEFYKCLTCNKNICSSCRSFHQSNHYIINYEQKNYICQNHHESFIKYCHDCKMNICIKCSEAHSDHNIESFEDMDLYIPMTRVEQNALRSWARRGYDVETNPGGYTDCDGWPLNYLQAYRLKNGYSSGPWDYWKAPAQQPLWDDISKCFIPREDYC